MKLQSTSIHAPNRNWLLYLLRTLVVAAVVVVWMQSQIKTVRERESLIKAGHLLWGVSVQNPPGIRWMWSLFGARPINLIGLHNDVYSEQDVTRYQAAFPEAEIMLGNPEYFRDAGTPGRLMSKYRSPPEIDPKSWAHAAN